MIIEVDRVTKSFGSNLAVNNVSFSVSEASIFGLLGPNGAGKTTLINILTTLLKPDSGRVTVDGLDVVRDAAELRSRIGLAGQYAAVDENLTGFENLEMVGRLYHLPAKLARIRADELLSQFSLAYAGRKQARTYSGGMRRRLDLAAALVSSPRVLFLDEPTAGLDPRSRNDLWDVLEQLVANGATILLTTQYLEEADRLAEHIAVIDVGKVIAMGTPSDLKAQVGSSILEVVLGKDSNVETAKQALSPLAVTGTRIDFHSERLRVIVPERPGLVVDAIRLLDQHQIEVEEIGVTKPSLDDAFLALTGHGVGGLEDE